MRTLTSFMNVTVDGYFEGPQHDISFFKGDDQDNTWFREQASSGATMLFGHRTYDLMKSWWPTRQASEANPEVARYMNEMPKLVAARKPFDPGWSQVTVLHGDAAAEIRKLKKGPGKDIVILGSNALCVSLMGEGLIDEFQIMVSPIVLGDGTPLFKGFTQKEKLKLVDTRPLASGKVVHVYRPLAARQTSEASAR